MLFLSPQLYMGFVKLQADKGLGRSFAGLLAFVTGMHQLGYLNDTDYEVFSKRYSRGLAEIAEDNQPETKESLAQKTEIQKLDAQFGNVLDQWPLHTEAEWRSKWIEKAQKYQETVPNAKKLLSIIEPVNTV